MSKALSSRTLKRALIFAPLALVPPACNGTEADNPFADVVNTPCKGDDDYDPAQEQADWEALHASRMPATPASGYGTARAASTSPRSIPIGLQCLAWKLVGSQLEVEIENFSSGCSIEWEGRARVDGTVVTIELENSRCAVAACFSCIYDTGTIVTLPAVTPITLQLSADSVCDGMPRVTTWELPLDTQPSGLSCIYAHPTASAEAAAKQGRSGEEFSWCGAGLSRQACNAGYSCQEIENSLYAGARCLRPCSADTDCTFGGGVACREGYCALP
jgi:hypothetical protein